jgi:hypothetical protein
MAVPSRTHQYIKHLARNYAALRADREHAQRNCTIIVHHAEVLPHQTKSTCAQNFFVSVAKRLAS